MSQGYIKLYRAIQDSEFYLSERFTKTQAWIDLLLLANHKPQTIFIRGIETRLQPGDLFWSKESLAKRWRWNRRTVDKYLTVLSSRGRIAHNVHNKIGVISIIKWAIYQKKDDENTQQSTRQNTQDIPDKIHTNKNVKNEENVKNEIIISSDIIIKQKLKTPKINDLSQKDRNDYLKFRFPNLLGNSEFLQALGEFIESRKKIHKAPTNRAIELWLIECEKYPIEDAICMVNNSIAGGYQGIFPLKDGKSNSVGHQSFARQDLADRMKTRSFMQDWAEQKDSQLQEEMALDRLNKQENTSKLQ